MEGSSSAPDGAAGVGPRTRDGTDGVHEVDGVRGGPRSEAKCLARAGRGRGYTPLPPRAAGEEANAAKPGFVVTYAVGREVCPEYGRGQKAAGGRRGGV